MFASKRLALMSILLGMGLFGGALIPPAHAAGVSADPDFFWLPPTVSDTPTPTGPFDAGALNSLRVEVCELTAGGACVPGEPLERFTSTTLPVPSQLKVDMANEFFTLQWLTANSRVNRDLFYRISVFKQTALVGSIDVDFVQNTPELQSVDARRYIGVVLGQQLTIQFRVQQPTARTRVKINEIESQGGTPDDWVELYNSAGVPLSLAGYVMKDNDDTHVYTFPAGATIPAQGFYVAEGGNSGALGYGLGGEDAVRFYAPGGTVLVDSYSWTEHALTTYGRCPNGTGAFQVNTTVTKGAANDCSIVITLNEIESDGGTPGDWIELYNPGPGPANLAGFVLKDNDNAHSYTLNGPVLAAGAYLVVEQATLGFALDAPDSVRLFRPDATLADSYEWTIHATNTYGRCPNGAGAFGPTVAATKGSLNNCFTPTTAIRINEVESNGGTPDDWFELINTGATPVDLSGWGMLDNDDTHVKYIFPPGSTIAAGGYKVVDTGTSGFNFGLGAADSVRIYDPLGGLYEIYSWTAHAATTYGRCPNGTGAFTTTSSSTKGAANDCSSPVKINEVESSGGTPGDWVELYNPSAAPASVGGFIFKDNDDTHVYTIPAGTTIAAGGYLVLDELISNVGHFNFGLGSADSARLFDSSGTTLVDSYSWTAHAATTYGRCPNGAGAFTTTSSSTKGTANDCGISVRINEIESDGGTPGDWVELINTGAAPANISGFVLRDNNDASSYIFPAGTTIAAGGYLVIDNDGTGVNGFNFGLGAADSVRLYDTTGTALLDSYTWTAHAVSTTYGRCPNGTGAFTTTAASTKGAANTCPGDPLPWPGATAVSTVDGVNVFGGNLSGLVYEGSGSSTPGTLWGVRNGVGSLFRLIWNGTIWTPDAANDWGAGKTLAYPGGTGSPDAEGVTFAGTSSLGGLYVSTERDNNNNGVSRNSILLFDPAAAGATQTATREWNLTADLPATGANLGMEAITWVPDTFLTSQGFIDESKNLPYVPADYPDHGTGLFFIGLEANGAIYAYALNHVNGTFTRIATISSGFTGVMDLHFDRDTNDLWAVCDDTCNGRTAILRVDSTTHNFTVARVFERPTGMNNLNNEGFTIAPLAECVSSLRPVYYADDGNTDQHSIRKGQITCNPIP